MRISDWSSDVCSSDLGDAAEQIGQLAGTTNDILDKEGRPLMADLRKTVATAKRSMENLEAAISEVQPGLNKFSTSTMPDVGRLVRHLGTITKCLTGGAKSLDKQVRTREEEGRGGKEGKDHGMG